VHLAIAGAAYAGVLVARAPDNAVARWLTTFATLLIAATFVDQLVRRLRRNAGAAEVSAARLEDVARAMQRISRSATREDVYGALRGSVEGIAGVRSPGAGGYPPAAPRPGALVLPIAIGAAGAPADAWLVAALEDRSTGVRHAVEMLAGEASSALTRIELMERLSAAAQTDELTGVPNRRSWDQELSRALANARRFDLPLAVAILDLDGFKELNDSMGHRAGDDVLAAAARRWSGVLRDIDTLARWGGDEFAIIVPGCSFAEAAEVVERVRRMTPGTTCSAGLVSWDRVEDATALMTRADGALYRAKRGGRDRLVVQDDPGPVAR
jgi:diguanylate cyclase (GGDEF)-like protein